MLDHLDLVADEMRDPSECKGSQPTADRRESVADLRAAIANSLEEIIDRLEEAQRAAVLETERRAALIAGERLGEAVGEFRHTVREIIAAASRQLEDRAAATEPAAEAAATTKTRARARVSASVAAQVLGAAKRFSEWSRCRLEAAGVASAGFSEVETRFPAIERPSLGAGAQVERAMARIEGAVEHVEQAERRTLETEERVRAMEQRVKDVAETVARAGEWEARMWTAIRIEDEVARRIREAEERILGLVGEVPSSGEPRIER